MFKSTRDIVSTYVNLEIATRTRLRDLWSFIRDSVDDPETFKAETIDSLAEVGCDPKKFRDEFNLATAMGPHDDERSHPYAFTPQMQAAIGKVAEAAKCDRDEAYGLICESHPTTGASKILRPHSGDRRNGRPGRRAEGRDRDGQGQPRVSRSSSVPGSSAPDLA